MKDPMLSCAASSADLPSTIVAATPNTSGSPAAPPRTTSQLTRHCSMRLNHWRTAFLPVGYARHNPRAHERSG